MSITINRVTIKVIMRNTTTIVRIWITIFSYFRTLPSATWKGRYKLSLFPTSFYSYQSLKP